MFLALMIWNLDTDLFLRCINNPLQAGGRAGALVRMLIAIPCSVYAFNGGSILEHVATASFFGSIPFAIMAIGFMKRHRAYWDTVRAREKLARAEKRKAKSDRVNAGLDGQS